MLAVFPYFVYDGGSARRTDSHGHYRPGNSNHCYDKNLRNIQPNLLDQSSRLAVDRYCANTPWKLTAVMHCLILLTNYAQTSFIALLSMAELRYQTFVVRLSWQPQWYYMDIADNVHFKKQTYSTTEEYYLS